MSLRMLLVWAQAGTYVALGLTLLASHWYKLAAAQLLLGAVTWLLYS